MFADDKSIENMQQLFIEFKKYLELQKEYTKLEVTEKLSKLLSTLLLVLLVVILGVVVLFHLSLYLSSAGRRANDEFCTYHVLPYPTHRSACPIPQKAHY
mgnify:CR=1 FL=1